MFPPLPLPGNASLMTDTAKMQRCSENYRLGSDTMGLYKYYLCLNDSRFLQIFKNFDKSKERDRSRELPMLAGIIGVYSLFILSGGFGNGLVMVTVCRNRHMRTARNLFIFNLAVSDFILCFLTQPLNILRLFPRYISWNFGITLCKAVNTLTGVNMFVSAFSITAIALDRFQVIVYPTRTRMEKRTMGLCLAAIWGAACMMASPLALFADTLVNLHGRNMCSEVTNGIFVLYAKLAYSLGIMLVQYLVPLGIVSAAYARICLRLQDRMRSMKDRQPRSTSSYAAQRQAQEAARRRRANILLVTIAVVFGLSWLPLTVVNIMQDLRLVRVQKAKAPVASGEDSHLAVAVSQSVPLLLVLVSACLNPVLYGWFNENFQTEFHRLLCLNRIARAGPKFKAKSSGSQAAAASQGAAAAGAAAAGAVVANAGAADSDAASSAELQQQATVIPLIVLNPPEINENDAAHSDGGEDGDEADCDFSEANC